MPAKERRHGGGVIPVTEERRMLPAAYYVRLNQEEMNALKIEAHNLQSVLDAVTNERQFDGSWRFNDGAGFLAHSFREKVKFFVDAFRNMNRTDVTPGAIHIVRNDYVEIDNGKVRLENVTETYHVTSGSGAGMVLTFPEMYLWFSRLFYTNIRDNNARADKQTELLDILKKNPNVVIGMSSEVFEAGRAQHTR